jgi:GNAT superfamily N-acetyltransferase
MGFAIAVAGETDLAQLLALMRAYCDFYETSPSDDALLAISRALLREPEREGFQLIARDDEGSAVGFATVFFTLETTVAARIAVMNDLFVTPAARGAGLADELIAHCARLARAAGARSLDWVTADENLRAQRVYDRVGAAGGGWKSYTLTLR